MKRMPNQTTTNSSTTMKLTRMKSTKVIDDCWSSTSKERGLILYIRR